MKDLDFIKKCVPFADGFTLSINENNPLNVPVIYIENNGFSKRYIVREKTFQYIIYPDLLTKTIEGINRKSFLSNGRFEIRNYRWGLSIQDNLNMLETAMPYDHYENVSLCKRAAIEYVLKQVNP